MTNDKADNAPDFIEKDYFDLNDKPCTLYHLVKTQPEWACNQIENYHSYKKGWINKGRVEEEYILKSVADKQMTDAMKPIRDTLEDYLVNGEYHVTLDDFISAIRETIKKV